MDGNVGHVKVDVGFRFPKKGPESLKISFGEEAEEKEE